MAPKRCDGLPQGLRNDRDIVLVANDMSRHPGTDLRPAQLMLHLWSRGCPTIKVFMNSCTRCVQRRELGVHKEALVVP